MTTLHKILQSKTQTRFATDVGTKTHAQLQKVVINATNSIGEKKLVSQIKAKPEISRLFSPLSQTEVPIAGTIKGTFISRRIDRLLINHNSKTVEILDYKTDTNPETFRNKYITQIYEYTTLLQAIYPDYTITGYILWTHDFSLEKVNKATIIQPC